ncbi:MAG: hypothetical protein ACQGVC_14530 [Myxococcota bacterium]
MRRALAWGAALVLAAAGGAWAQEAPPDVPAGDAVIEGRVVDEAGGAGVGDVGVILYSLLPNGDPGLRQGRADADGRFRFEGVSGDPEIVYLVGTRVGGVPFGARAVFQSGESVRTVEIEVATPSRDVAAVAAREIELRVEQGCSHLRIHHRHDLTNASERVVFVPPEERADAEAIFEVRLPEGATEIESPVGTATDGFLREGRRLRFFGPVYPGSAGIEFAYGLPREAATDLEIGLPAGADRARVLVPVGADVEGEGLRDEGERPLPIGVHRSLRADRVEEGGSLRLAVRLDEGAAAPLEVAEARLWIELDDAAMDVNETWQLRVEGDAPLEASGGAPLLCVPLPAGAESLRFSNASLEMGLSSDPDGALALRGPIPPGDPTLALRYQLPTTTPARFERRFATDVELLTLLVADTGIVPETDRLHRRRPVRTEDRSYLHLEAFGIEGGETVSLGLRTLPPRRPLPALASTGLVLLVAVGALFYLIGPLRGARAAEPEVEAEETGISRERQAVYASIDALDEDFETGKLSAEDHQRMRAELRARAVALLQAERAAETAGQAASADAKPAAAAACGQCGAPTQAGDRFCAQCGAALPSPPGPPAS